MPLSADKEHRKWMGELAYDIIGHLVERKVKFRDIDKILSFVKSIAYGEMFDGLVTLDLPEGKQELQEGKHEH